MLALLRSLWVDESGQGMVEYGLIIALVAVVVIGALILMREQIATTFNRIASELQSANNP